MTLPKDDKALIVIDGIAKCQPSGGRTSTDLMVARLRESGRVVSYHNSLLFEDRYFAKILLNLPCAIFVILAKKFQFVLLEFFTRVSLFLPIRLMFLTHGVNQSVILNHHAVFWLAFLLKKKSFISVFHDVLSLKTVQKGSIGSWQLKIIKFIERYVCEHSDEVWTFSLKDQLIIKDKYHVSAKILPVISLSEPCRRQASRTNTAICVGNWYRSENSHGLRKLLDRIALIKAAGEDTKRMRVAILGTGAHDLKLPTGHTAEIIGRYGSLSDFDAKFLVAPITHGAGIKVKVLEAWHNDFIVIGTPLAFEGIPHTAIQIGGIVLENIDDIARMLSDENSLILAEKGRSGARAFLAYRNLFT